MVHPITLVLLFEYFSALKINLSFLKNLNNFKNNRSTKKFTYLNSMDHFTSTQHWVAFDLNLRTPSLGVKQHFNFSKAFWNQYDIIVKLIL